MKYSPAAANFTRKEYDVHTDSVTFYYRVPRYYI